MHYTVLRRGTDKDTYLYRIQGDPDDSGQAGKGFWNCSRELQVGDRVFSHLGFHVVKSIRDLTLVLNPAPW